MPKAARIHGSIRHAWPSRERRGTASQRGYGSRWQRARAGYLLSHPYCAACECDGKITLANVVDHIVPHRGDMALFWRAANWQPLCTTCHNRKTATQDGGFGNLTAALTAGPCLCTVVCGPPGAGKTYYVQQHRADGDLVYDLDVIASALNPAWARIEGRPNDVAHLLLAWRDSLIQAIKAGRLSRDCWLIVTDRKRAFAIADEIEAKTVML
jgi:5-methylcytosine-specific restriction protein A